MNTQCTNPNCENPAETGICRNCADTARRDLKTFPELWTELDTTRFRLSKTTAAQEGRSANQPLNWNEYAAQAATDLAAVCTAWAKDIHHAGDTDPCDPLPYSLTHPAHTACWLYRNFHALLRLEDIGDFADALTNATIRARRAIDLPALRTRFTVGPCPELLADIDSDGKPTEVPCAGEVWAFIPADPDRHAWMRCTSCAAEWDTTQWLRAGERMLKLIEERQAG